jgi:acyl transferase domain-containing protein/acyl-CoA synthetase (AMP-forming)/AMP-acid ligase II/pimeloyl-ACP methyl ester carboxylesterase/acyl carrier protein/NAD(P)-dependent dehydrogenase (short-subunit alcohol dehydrogenase family)
LNKYHTFIDELQERVIGLPDKIAFTLLQDGETELDKITYRQLELKARAIAGVLQSYKVQGERALLLYQPGLEFITAFLGCLYAGVIAVPAYPPRANRSSERVFAIVDDARAKFVLTTQDIERDISSKFDKNSNLQFISTDTIEDELADSWQYPDLTTDNIAFLQYTSGSTGTPKGVMVSHGNLLANSISINRCFQNTPEHTAVSWLPPYHDMGLIGCIIQPMYVGLSMYLMAPVTFLQRPYRWLQAISRYGANTSGGPNFAYDLCVDRITEEQKTQLDLSCWELAFSGAEPVRAETINKFSNYFASCGFQKKAFYPCYGMAESTLIITGGNKQAEPIFKSFAKKSLESDRVILAEGEDATPLVGCGSNLDGQSLAIVNPDSLRRCSDGEIGEIWAKSASVARGYWQRAELTETAFNGCITDSQETGFLRTGDLGFLQDGELFVTGRIKDLIIIRGRNHYPQDIELTVDRSHPAIRPAAGAAFAVEIDGEEKLVITQEIQRSALRELDTEAVVKAVRQAVLQHHELTPYAVILLKTGSIPKTSSGKIQRHACKAGFLDSSLNAVGEWRQFRDREKQKLTSNSLAPRREASPIGQFPTSAGRQVEIETWLVERSAQLLNVPPSEIDIDEAFATSGLDSVQAVRLSADLEDWLEVKLSPTLIYDYPNIKSLARYLAGLEDNSEVNPNQVNNQSPIAIIGMGCRLPGANNLDEFWQLLIDGKDAISRCVRWEGDDWGGFIKDVDKFEPQFFGITPRETQRMDPQQRLLLEVCWEALENAAINPESLSGSKTGVFVGIGSSDYAQLQLHYQTEVDAYAGTGNAHSIAANRLSYILDLRGPSLAVDTACSSSLVAVHLACQSLKNGECDRAIVGGVNLMLSPELTRTFTLAGMMAADGRCKTFDDSADGYVRGEGCGVIILKRLDEAIIDRDRILAVIAGSAIEQDGRSNGLTAPNGRAQQTVIRQALANAGIPPQAINYIEAHGTGTKLGDPIEVNSLKAVLMADREADNICYLSSVKTNIGHLEAAAGIAGLIKTVLCLEHQAIPPHLHFQQLNSHIDLTDTPLVIPTQLQSWHQEQLRFAGVSSFGFGGTNAHVIVQEAPTQTVEPAATRPLHLLNLSTKTAAALPELARRYVHYLTAHPVELADLCFTANTGRTHFENRLSIIADSIPQLQAQLNNYCTGNKTTGLISSQVTKTNRQEIVFLFTGQGSQYRGMGEQLYHTQPLFRQALDRCGEILQPYLERSLLEVIFLEGEIELDSTQYTQPAIFALEYALAQMWLSWGIKPDAVMGHSVGEYVAATVAGVFGLEDGLKLIATRGKLMQSLPLNGGMYAIFASEEIVKSAIEPVRDLVAIAAINNWQSITISGELNALQQVIKKLDDRGIKNKQLNVSHAFHSPLMADILEEFGKVAESIDYAIPQIKLVSNVTGKFVTTEIARTEYWIDHIIAPVQFARGMELLKQEQYEIFLEIGAKPILLGMGRTIEPNLKRELWLPSLRPRKSDWQQILQSLTALYHRGVNIDWQEIDRDNYRQKIALPNYPFQRESYWLEPGNNSEATSLNSTLIATNPLDLYQETWQLQGNLLRDSTVDNHQDNWLILADDSGLGEKLASKVNNSRLVYWQENLTEFKTILTEKSITKIIYLWGLNIEPKQDRAILNLVRDLFKTGITVPIWLVTKNNTDSEFIIQGMSKAIAVEHPEYWGGIIELDEINNTITADYLLTAINNAENEDRLAIKNNNLYTARLQKLDRSIQNNNLNIAAENSYLITGGWGALGLQVAQWLLAKGAKHLILVGRSQPNSNALKIIEKLQATATIEIKSIDITQLEPVRDLINNYSNLKGIIHAAGILDDGVLQNQTWEKFEKVISPKVDGAWNLHKATQDLALDFFVMFSSVASLIGSPGQSNYSVANAGLDAIARYRQRQNLPALSINWGPWANTGMAAEKQFQLSGMELINPQTALEQLEVLINSNLTQVGVMSVDWQRLSEQFAYVRTANYFDLVLDKTKQVEVKIESTAIFAELLAINPTERSNYLTEYLQSAIAQILQVDKQQLSVTDSLLDLGMDSLMVMEAIDRLKKDLQLMLYPREFYERPKIESLAQYLAVEFSNTHSLPHSPTPQRSHSPLTSPIAFILSSPRSGSTLLRVMLEGHPDIASPPELHLLPFETMKARETELGISHLGEGLQKALMTLKNIDAAASQELVESLVRDNLTIREVYQMLQQLAGNRLLVDKSPTYASSRETLDRAETIFKNAKYIHLVRHPYAVIESFARMRMDKLIGSSTSDPYKLAETIWQDSNQNVLDFCSEIDPSRYHLVHYEELVARPQQVMTEICQFLNIPFNPAVLTPYQGDRMTDGVHHTSMSLGDPNFGKHQQIEADLGEKWREIQLPRILNSFTQQIANKLNYELIQEANNISVSILPMQEISLNIRGLRICLCTWGPEEGPIILCLHGILEQGAAWSEVAIRLAQKGYRVIAPDLRGHGRSDRVGKGGSYNLIDFIADIDAIVENLAGKAFTLVGHSLGSVLAAIFTSIRPQRINNIVLVETILPTGNETEDPAEQLAHQLDYLASPPKHPVFPNVEAAAERLRKATPAISKSLAMLLAERITEPCEGGVRWRWEPLLRTRAGISFNGIGRSRYLSLLKKIKVPITLVYGDKSNFNRHEDLAQQQEAMPGAVKVVVPGGHNLPLEAPSALAKIISGAVALTTKLIP